VHGVGDQDDEDEVDHGVAGGFASATSDGDKKATDAEAEAEHPPTVAMGLQQVEAAVHDIKDVGSGAAAADGDDMKAPGAGPPPPPPAEDDDDDLAAADEWDSGEDVSADEDEEVAQAGAAFSENDDYGSEDESAEDGSRLRRGGGDDDEGEHHLLGHLRSAAGLVLLLGLGAGAAAALAFVASSQPRYDSDLADHQSRSTDAVVQCGGADDMDLAVQRYCYPRGATSTATATPRPPHRLVVPVPLPAGNSSSCSDDPLCSQHLTNRSLLCCAPVLCLPPN
jgi:hypothetical protein